MPHTPPKIKGTISRHFTENRTCCAKATQNDMERHRTTQSDKKKLDGFYKKKTPAKAGENYLVTC